MDENNSEIDRTLIKICIKKKVGFVGAGNMAWAIFQKLLKMGLPANNVHAAAPSMRNLANWKSTGASVYHENDKVVENSEIIFLAMKPQHFLAEKEIAWACHTNFRSKLFVSIMAGIPITLVHSKLQDLCRAYEYKLRVVRVMPNTPLSVGFGCSVFCMGNATIDEDKTVVKTLLSGEGSLAEEVPESLMDAAGAVVGCGPAYMYQMLEAMADGAVKQGVPRALGAMLAAQTMLGAAQMVLHTGKNPSQLKDEVCSPAGTTIAGLYALKKAPNFSIAVMDAVEAATERSKELVTGILKQK